MAQEKLLVCNSLYQVHDDASDVTLIRSAKFIRTHKYLEARKSDIQRSYYYITNEVFMKLYNIA